MHDGRGPSQSRTITWNAHVETLPSSSRAVHVTVVGPSGNADPDGGSHWTSGVPSQLSLADAWYVTMAEHAPGSLHAMMSAGHVRTGGSQSVTVTSNSQLATLLLSSVAVHVTCVVPR